MCLPQRKASCCALPCRPSERGEDWHSVTSHLSSSSFAWDTQSQGSRQSNASAASSQVCMQAVHSVLAALASILSVLACPAGIRVLKFYLRCLPDSSAIAWEAALGLLRHEQGLMQALYMLSAVYSVSGAPCCSAELCGRVHAAASFGLTCCLQQQEPALQVRPDSAA